jgi:hypothetical protein
MDLNCKTILVITKDEWDTFVKVQNETLNLLRELSTNKSTGVYINHITAREFMEAVRIKRTKFDQLVVTNKIKVIKKRRKIYVPVSEVERYFADPKIQ